MDTVYSFAGTSYPKSFPGKMFKKPHRFSFPDNRCYIIFAYFGRCTPGSFIDTGISLHFIKGVDVQFVPRRFVFHDIMPPKKLSYSVTRQAAGFFLIISRSVSSGFVFKLYSFSNIRSPLFSLNFRFMAATNPGRHCIFVSFK